MIEDVNEEISHGEGQGFHPITDTQGMLMADTAEVNDGRLHLLDA